MQGGRDRARRLSPRLPIVVVAHYPCIAVAQPGSGFGSQSLVRLPHAGQGDRRGIWGASYGNGPLTVPLPDVGAEGDTTARNSATHASEKAKQMGRPGIA